MVAAAEGLDEDVASAGDQVSGHLPYLPLEGAGSGLPPQGLVAPVRGPPAGGTGTGVKGRTIDERTHSP